MTIRGVGVDMCQLERLKNMTLQSRFVTRFFSEAEQAYLAGKGRGFIQSLAAMYAAKEAFAKALGTGFRYFELRDVQVLHTPEGQPYYEAEGKALEVMKERKIHEIHLSITHEAGLALAFALAWGEA